MPEDSPIDKLTTPVVLAWESLRWAGVVARQAFGGDSAEVSSAELPAGQTDVPPTEPLPEGVSDLRSAAQQARRRERISADDVRLVAMTRSLLGRDYATSTRSPVERPTQLSPAQLANFRRFGLTERQGERFARSQQARARIEQVHD